MVIRINKLAIEFLENLFTTGLLPGVFVLNCIGTIFVLRFVVNTVIDTLNDVPDDTCLLLQNLLGILLVLLGSSLLFLTFIVLVVLALLVLLNISQSHLLRLTLLDLNLDPVVIFFNLDVAPLIHEYLSSPLGNDQPSLFLSDGVVAFLVLLAGLVLLRPLVFHFAVQVGTQFEVNLLLLENTFDERLEHIGVMNLFAVVRIHFYFQTLHKFKGVHLFHYDSLFVIHQIPILLPGRLFLLARIVTLLVDVQLVDPFAQWWWQLVQQKDKLLNGDPTRSLRVVILPKFNQSFNFITLYNTHILLLGSVETFNDCCYRKIHDQH